MARRDSNDANPILWIIFLIALYISTFFVDIPTRTTTCFSVFSALSDPASALLTQTTFSASAAAVCLILIAVSLHVFNNKYSSGLNFILPLLYLILVLANPYSIYFTPFHAAALLLVWAISHFVKFKAASGHASDLFSSFFLLVVASCFYSPLVWLLPFLIVAGFAYSESKSRYVVTTLLSVVCAAGAVLGTVFLLTDTETTFAIPRQYLDSILAVDIRAPHISILQAVRDGSVAILVVIAIVRNVRNQGKYKIAESRMLSDVTLCAAILFAIMVLFITDYSLPFGLVVLAPTSMVIFGLFGDSKKTLVTIFSLVVMGLIVAERAACFIEIDGSRLMEMLKFI